MPDARRHQHPSSVATAFVISEKERKIPHNWIGKLNLFFYGKKSLFTIWWDKLASVTFVARIAGNDALRIVSILRVFGGAISMIFLLLLFGTESTTSPSWSALAISVAFSVWEYNTPVSSPSSPLQFSTLPSGSTSCGEVGITSHSIIMCVVESVSVWSVSTLPRVFNSFCLLFVPPSSYWSFFGILHCFLLFEFNWISVIKMETSLFEQLISPILSEPIAIWWQNFHGKLI